MLQPLCWRRLHAGNPPQPDGTPPLPWPPHQTPGGWWLVRRSSAAAGTEDLLAGGSVLKRLGSLTWCTRGCPTGPTHGLCPGKALLSWALPVSRCAPSRSRSWICSPGAGDGPGEGPPAAGGAFRSGMPRHCAGRVYGKMCNLFQLRRGLWRGRCHSKVWACRYPGKAPEPGAPGVAVPQPRCAARCDPAWQRGPGKAASPAKGLSRRSQGSPLLHRHPWGRQGGRFGPVQQILAEGKLGAAGCNESHARGGESLRQARHRHCPGPEQRPPRGGTCRTGTAPSPHPAIAAMGSRAPGSGGASANVTLFLSPDPSVPAAGTELSRAVPTDAGRGHEG